jgi:hypothetical protein
MEQLDSNACLVEFSNDEGRADDSADKRDGAFQSMRKQHAARGDVEICSEILLG